MSKNLMLVSTNIPCSLPEEIACDRYPRTDFFQLSERLGADIVSYDEADKAPSWLDRLVRRAFGRASVVALEGFRRSRDADLILTTSESIGVPLALLLKISGRQRRHLMVGHRLSPPKKVLLWKLFKLQDHVTTLIVYSEAQREIAVNVLRMNPEKVIRIPFMADQHFFRPMPDIPERHQICSVGLEWRDYPTLIKAARKLSCDVKIAAASPWSKSKNEAEGRELPPNVDVRKYKYLDLRRLYAESKIVVIPLRDTDFQPGRTSMLEAMAMGKPVIVTKTAGQPDTAIDGETGLYVSPGDPEELQSRIQFLLENEAERKRIGQNGLRAFENSFTLDHLVDRIAKLAEAARSNGSLPHIKGTP